MFNELWDGGSITYRTQKTIFPNLLRLVIGRWKWDALHFVTQYYYEPETGHKFRSLVAVKRFLAEQDENENAPLSKTLEEIMENKPLAKVFKLENRYTKVSSNLSFVNSDFLICFAIYLIIAWFALVRASPRWRKSKLKKTHELRLSWTHQWKLIGFLLVHKGTYGALSSRRLWFRKLLSSNGATDSWFSWKMEPPMLPVVKNRDEGVIVILSLLISILRWKGNQFVLWCPWKTMLF